MGSTIRKNSPTVARIFGGKQTQLKTDSAGNLFVTVSQSNGGVITSFQDPSDNDQQSTTALDGTGITGNEYAALISAKNTVDNTINTLQISHGGNLQAATIVQQDTIATTSGSDITLQGSIANAISNIPSTLTGVIIINVQYYFVPLTNQFEAVIVYSLDT